MANVLVARGVILQDTQEALPGVMGGTRIPAELLKNTTAMALLKQRGVIISDRGIIENPDVFKKYENYIDVLTFLSDVERDGGRIQDKEEVVKKYIWLMDDSSDEIWDKKYI